MKRRRRAQQDDLFVMSDQLPKSEGHAFYRKLNELLASAGFDDFVERKAVPVWNSLYRPELAGSTVT